MKQIRNRTMTKIFLQNNSEISNLRVAYFAGTMKYGHDGVTRVLYKIIDELKRRNISNIFFSSIVPDEGEQPTEMIEVPSIKFPLYKDYKLALPTLHLFEKRLNEFKPDILHINSPCTLGHAAVKYAKKHNLPVVATYHTHFASYAKYYKIRMLEPLSWNIIRNLYNKCDKVFVPSIPIMDELISHGLDTLEYLPHGVDTKLFNPEFKQPGWKEKIGIKNKTALLFAGRLVWEKDLAVLAESYKILNSKRNDIAFVIAGDGPIKNELLQLMPDAVFLGQLNSKELAAAYASSDIFVFPSTTETFGNVTLEAMASGMPAVCAREGGAYGIINEGINGLISEPHNAGDFSAKIYKLVEDTSLRERMSAHAFNFASEQSWETILHKLFSSYIEIINNHNEISSINTKVA